MPPKKGKAKEDILIEDSKPKKKGKAKGEEDPKNLSEEDVENVKVSKAVSRKKKGKKGDISDAESDDFPKETQKPQPKNKAASKKKNKGKVKNDDWSGDEPVDLINGAKNDESDEKEVVPVKKQQKKKQKTKGKAQDWSDHDEPTNDFVLAAADSDNENLLPGKKSKKKQKPKKALESGSEDGSDELVLPLSEDEQYHEELLLDKNQPIKNKALETEILPEEKLEDDILEKAEEMEEPEENIVANNQNNRALNVTYVVEPRLTRSQAKKITNDVDKIAEEVKSLEIDSKKSKLKLPIVKKGNSNKPVLASYEDIVEVEENGEKNVEDISTDIPEQQKKLTHKEKKKLKKEQDYQKQMEAMTKKG